MEGGARQRHSIIRAERHRRLYRHRIQDGLHVCTDRMLKLLSGMKHHHYHGGCLSSKNLNIFSLNGLIVSFYGRKTRRDTHNPTPTLCTHLVTTTTHTSSLAYTPTQTLVTPNTLSIRQHTKHESSDTCNRRRVLRGTGTYMRSRDLELKSDSRRSVTTAERSAPTHIGSSA